MLGKRLTFENIEKSQNIQNWLSQFSTNDVLTAKSLLCRLRFISRDEFSNWLLSKLTGYSNHGVTAVYAVRKFRKKAQCLWQRSGNTQPRPAQTQGSEDFVSSIISNSNRQHNNCFLDHPSINELKNRKVRHIILVDDSIGSGKRIGDFIQLMTNSKTFLSWWNGGFITLYILSYARTRQSKGVILKRTPGSDHGTRKIRLSSKLRFDNDFVYDAFDIHTRWGNRCQSILSLCSSIKNIAKDRRKGFGNVMGNIIFYHSVPNNIPGLLFSKNNRWNPLFPKRSLPDWTIDLLEKKTDSSENSETAFEQIQFSESMGPLLKSIKAGLRTRASLSRRLDCDECITQGLVDQAIQLGLISHTKRLLKAGEDYLLKENGENSTRKPDYTLYVPQSWCADQETIQPSDHDVSETRVQTDSIDPESMDGDDGESSLERTDAMATPSPMRDVPQYPSWARERHIPHGPTGLKE
ncbi:hypothetical protein [uncultured Desulfobacter sp.]|uniref:phosphoribosyltransferase-like protein n=1 Tax=uncultured Desulfobacter sp. TaxID=240139 RepID=UPI0029C95894|nr:hypothetical protein [uncultured Desulfobacter sp.]